MKIVFEHNTLASPQVSVILIDWSCRESLHILRYLADQTVPREQYEVIWIEYYNRHPSEIENGLKECERLGKPPIVDKWIVMGMADNIYYHKHLMFNIGIVASRGKILTFCDSDSIVSPTFVESIIKSFERDKNIVLHIDEVRNTDRRFYPFNYPSIEEIKGKGCFNWKDRKTTGLLDKEDPLHALNYGACMSALREDLISIGGADEHIDYLGHICGPYELTFRLINTGKREVWHQEEFLYHVWHPGTDGVKNYLGPHDGRNMSTTALAVRLTGRVMPLVENPAIKVLRLNQGVKITEESLLLQAIREKEVENWMVDKLERNSIWKSEILRNHKVVWLWFLKMLIKQFYMKITRFSRKPKNMKDIGRKPLKIPNFFKNMSQYNFYVIEECAQCLQEIKSNRGAEAVIYGTGNLAEILYILSRYISVKIPAVYDDFAGKQFKGLPVLPLEEIINYLGNIIIASTVNVEEKIKTLKAIGVDASRIMVLRVF
jgi:hypothetical protein